MSPSVALEAPARPVSRTSLRRFLVLTCVGVVLARATYVTQPLRHDEGGLLFIARRWHTGGEFLYGDYFVDRPPLLMAIFRVAAISEWDRAVRVLAVGAALAFVLAAWHAGTSLSGQPGGRWSAAVAAGLMCSPAVAADQADGELFGAALVMAGVALALRARTASASRQSWLAGAAGVCAGAAPLVKQNLLDGLVFLVVLVAVATAGVKVRRELRTCGVVLVGALAPYVVLWICAAAADVDASSAWREVVAFRRDAFGVIWSHRPQASIRRFGSMVVLGLVSGLLPLLAVWVVAARRRPELPRPERCAVTALIVFGTVAVVAGGSYWPNYLLQLAPAAVLVAGALGPSASKEGTWARRVSRVVVTSAVVGTLAMGVVHPTVPRVSQHELLGQWLGRARASSDTAFVAYGNASVLEAADVPSPYPHLWSLPMRTLDPEQRRLRATLAGTQAPSWIVQVNPFDSWGIDDDSRLRDLVRARYRVVVEICGKPVWLRRDLTRRLPPAPRC